MRSKGTKYDSVDQLPGNALPISTYARKYKVSSPAYVHVKYDRFKFGYPSKKDNTTLYGEDPGYEIVEFAGTCYVINYK